MTKIFIEQFLEKVEVLIYSYWWRLKLNDGGKWILTICNCITSIYIIKHKHYTMVLLFLLLTERTWFSKYGTTFVNQVIWFSSKTYLRVLVIHPRILMELQGEHSSELYFQSTCDHHRSPRCTYTLNGCFLGKCLFCFPRILMFSERFLFSETSRFEGNRTDTSRGSSH